MRVQAYASDQFSLPLPPGHRFPLAKYQRLREALESSVHADRLWIQQPPAASNEQLRQVHTAEYLRKLADGDLTPLEQRRIGLPWSPELVERSRRSTGATLAAARAALAEGAGINLAGGTHHAFPDQGQGFCVFNDVAVAIRVLQAEGRLQRALVIDLDVHPGNGTAAIFADDRRVFTFSMHGNGSYPFAHQGSDIDIALPPGTTDQAYLEALQYALDARLPWDQAELVFYLAGADPYEQDRFGKVKLTKAGLADRDRRVIAACRRHQLPLTLVMAGGYAKVLEDIVDIHAQSVIALLDAYLPADADIPAKHPAMR